ncbi:hypothetical protein K439DRAFT_595077 [Ramaria rubella]|nr:hypothetical protein K439DRAFT_595077 [Ramaria rubella]
MRWGTYKRFALPKVRKFYLLKFFMNKFVPFEGFSWDKSIIDITFCCFFTITYVTPGYHAPSGNFEIFKDGRESDLKEARLSTLSLLE